MPDSAQSGASVITAEEIERELALLGRLKSRVTGTAEQEQLVAHIEKQLTDAGLDVRSDTLSFTRWGPSSEASAALHIARRPVPIASVFPYSGVTGPDGVRGQLVRLRGPMPVWRRARRKIAVVEVSNFAVPSSAVIDTWDADAPWPVMHNPLVPTTLAGLGLARARKAGVKAVIFVWRNISDDNARGQYLPFTLGYQGIPAVFVSGKAGEAVLAGAAGRDDASVVLDYQLHPRATTRTIWTTVEGTARPDETVLVVTHTDGVNAVEENGHIATVAMARAAALDPPERTTVFVFTSGHMRIPAVTSAGQATQRFLSDHPELWAGTAGRRCAVAGLAVEHLGAREFIDDPAANQLRPTGRIEPELLYATTPELAHLARRQWRGDKGALPRISKPTPLVQFGEGEPLLHAGIPAISLVSTPLYLLAETTGDESHLVDNAALHRQVDNFERLYREISSVHIDDFGRVRKPTNAARLRGIASLVKAMAATKVLELRGR
ncbi:hypothetical protein AFM11_32205 [Mycolicibacterium wolinskyi]|uniref:Peptidase M28 domain-containing protein n=1 Tax=Mycolicibacterium wolinskyi TaxID=59750 RepID=A0A132PCZ7_9MYCO|nr:PA domain-containing protein [Mycolicibacterium wolinskyi]KWX20200.1 hypothetical protein AFM11_32205 [Mycolicibacterium wolinskyi]